MPPGLALFLVTAVWASSFVVSKHVVRVVPPVPYLAMRYGLAALLLLALFGPRLWAARGDRALRRDGLILGALNAIALCFQLVGQMYTTASKSAFITSLYMPLVPLFGLLLYKTQSSPPQLVAVAIASVGLLLLTYPTGGATVNPGDLLTVVSAILYAITILETSRRSRTNDSRLLSTMQVLVSGVLFGGLLGLSHVGDVRVVPDWAITTLRSPMNGSVLVAVLYMAMICTVLTFLVQNWAMSWMHVTHATIIFSLEAPIATAIGLLVDGVEEWPGPRGAVGAGMMLMAVGLSRRST